MNFAELINTLRFKVNDSDVKKANDTFASIKNTATKMLGALGIGFSLVKVNALVEEFGAANKQIKSAIGEIDNMNEVQNQLVQKANDARMAYGDMADFVSDLAKSSSELFPSEDAAQFTSTVAKLMKTSGRTDAEIASIMEGMNKSFQKGIVDTETLNKMLEQAPETANLFAESLGVSKTSLLEMASAGQITVQQLKDAFMDASGEIDSAFKNTDMTITEALKNIRNNWGLWITQLDETFGVTNTIARAMTKFSDIALRGMNKVKNATLWLSDKLGGTDRVLKLVAIAAGALFVAFNFSKITSGLSSLFKALTSIKKQTLLMAAAIIVVALLVEDFINFMQGNDSLIGTLLANAGVDIDKFRQNVVKVWGNIKTILSAIWLGIQNVAIPIFQGIWSVITTVFNAIGSVIRALLPSFAELIDKLANGEVDTEQWVKVGEAIAKVAAIVVGVIVVVKTVITVVKTVSAVISGVSAAISFLASPVGLIIAIILALIVVGILVWKNWDKIKAAAIRIWTAIKDFFSNTISAIGDFFKNTWQGIKDFFVGIWDAISSTVVNVVTSIWDTISNIFTTIWDFISGVATGIWETVSTAFTNVWDSVSTTVSGIWETISSIFTSIWDTISTTVTDIWDTITTTFTNIWTSITETVTGIYDSIVEGFTAAIDWIKALPEQALQWGIDIIQGIVDGINSAISWVSDAVSSVASTIQSFLGFSEPDEGPLSNFHTYMPDMIDLMSKGITAGKGKVKAALGDLAGDMSVMAQASIVNPGTAMTASGGGNVSKSVNQNVTINNRFEGDRAGQQKSAVAMNKAANDSTAELARALAYAR